MVAAKLHFSYFLKIELSVFCPRISDMSNSFRVSMLGPGLLKILIKLRNIFGVSDDKL